MTSEQGFLKRGEVDTYCDNQRAVPLILAPWSGRPIEYMIECVGTLRYDPRYRWGWMRDGGTGIDRVRSRLASKALLTEHEWWLWIDNDNVTKPEVIAKLVRDAQELDLDFLAAVVPCRSYRTWANIGGAPDLSGDILIGPGGGIVEVGHAGLALAVTHRRLFESMAQEFVQVDYPITEEEWVHGYPFFCPSVHGRSHYAEDVIFCARARELGHHLYADTRTVVLHETVYMLGPKDIQSANEWRLDKAREAAQNDLGRAPETLRTGEKA